MRSSTFMLRALAAMVLTTVTVSPGCSSSTPGGSYLYEKESEPPRLLDAEIKIETFHNLRSTKRNTELRVVKMKSGECTATVEKPRYRGASAFSFDAYRRIWDELRQDDYKTYKMEGVDIGGGPYHIVTVTLGRDLHQFSVQYTTNFLGLSDSYRNQPVEMLNEILKIIADQVPLERTQSRPADEPEEPTTKPAESM